jgi:hypothetical protein
MFHPSPVKMLLHRLCLSDQNEWADKLCSVYLFLLLLLLLKMCSVMNKLIIYILVSACWNCVYKNTDLVVVRRVCVRNHICSNHVIHSVDHSNIYEYQSRNAWVQSIGTCQFKPVCMCWYHWRNLRGNWYFITLPSPLPEVKQMYNANFNVWIG